MFIQPVLLPLASWALAAAVLIYRHGTRRQLSATEAALTAAHESESGLLRLIGTLAEELRVSALRLSGHAERLLTLPSRPAAADFDAMTKAIDDLLRIIDDLQERAGRRDMPIVLRDEPISLMALVEETIAAVSDMLSPGQRRWQVAPELQAIRLIADRRALHRILLRVFGNAVRLTRPGDWIELSGEAGADGYTLIVEDEGAGIASGVSEEQGNIPGMGLALARTLMEALGGGLTVESAARVGTRVFLRFPPLRVLASPLMPQAPSLNQARAVRADSSPAGIQG